MAQMLALGGETLLQTETPLVIGGTRTQVLAESVTIAPPRPVKLVAYKIVITLSLLLLVFQMSM